MNKQCKRRITSCVQALLVLSFGLYPTVNMADEYFAKDGGAVGGAIWYSVADPAASPVTSVAGSSYWVVNDQVITIPNVGDSRMDGDLFIGGTAETCPWATSYGGILRKNQWKGSKFWPAVNWYNGIIDTTARYVWTMKGAVRVKDGGPSAVHTFQVSDICDKWTGIIVSGNLSSDSTNVHINIVFIGATVETAKIGCGVFELSGDNSDYRGTIGLGSDYTTIYLSGVNSLGDPGTANPAALQVCDKGYVCLTVECPQQGHSRGIRLDGETAYVSSLFSTGSIITSPFSRKSDVAGRLIKFGAKPLTIDADYAAGDIDVTEGTLIFGAGASMPDGQKIAVRDGARLEIAYSPRIGRLDVTTEGTGTVVYQDGYRQNSAGVWEVRVRASSVGDGSVLSTECWAEIGTRVVLQATDGADAFCRWSGDILSLDGRGRDVFDRTCVVDTTFGPSALVANFGIPEKPENKTCTDGTTYDYENRVLRITVPGDVTHVGEYAASVSSGYVTNVVKTGAGALTLVAIPDYQGSFRAETGTVTLPEAGALGAEGVGAVSFASAAVMSVKTTGVVARGKRVFMSGSVKGDPSANNRSGFLTDCDVKLTGDTSWEWGSAGLDLPYSSTLDLAGHSLTMMIRQNWSYMSLWGLVVTNSDINTPCVLQIPDRSDLRLFEGTKFLGGVQNKLVVGYDASLRINTDVVADWNLDVQLRCNIMTGDNRLANTLENQWRGTLAAGGTSANQGVILYNNVTDGCLTFGGPVTGNGYIPIQGGIVNFLSPENTFSGTISLLDTKSSALRSMICVHDGAAFSAGETKPVVLSNGDFWIGSNTAFRLPSFNHCAGACHFFGGPAADKPCGRASLVNFTKSGGSTLTVDSPVVLAGRTDIQVGTLSLGGAERSENDLPIFSNLVFAAETSFDMCHNDLVVPNLTGFPSVLNPGKLTVAENWTIDYSDLVSGKVLDLGAGTLEFSPTATITVVNRNGQLSGETVIARAIGGIVGSPGVKGLHRFVKAENGELKLCSYGMMLIVR